ncbi:MAG: TonB-dependent receptor [Saprospiraceae bacterium]
MKTSSLIFAFLLLSFLVQAQVPTQTVRGTVTDQVTGQALLGVTLHIKNAEPPIGAITDIDGKFVLKNVPVGRQQVVANYIGYEPFETEPFVLNSAKEMVLELQLQTTSIAGNEVVIVYKAPINAPLNAAAVVSTRSFSVDETQRYAAAANDPGRMAQGLPGVQPSRDNRSDIVIRGNSGLGLLWRLEGIDIPNPNHFARRGTSGGGITIFSISMLANSDFSTGAFPAEYGNATAGVFDIKFRNGNPDKREYTFRAGLLGLDFSTEGPINKEKGSSYLLNYRYSTLGILNSMGLYLVGPRTDNTFQDLSFKLNFPSENNKHIVSFWGMGGMSREEFKSNEGPDNWRSFDDYHTYHFTTDMGAVGMTYSALLGDDAYIRTSLAAMSQHIINRDDTLNLQERATTYNDEDYIDGRYVLSSYLSKKLGEKSSLRTGVFLNQIFYNLNWTLPLVNPNTPVLDDKGSTLLAQPYAQIRYRPGAHWAFNAGLHAMFLNLNQDFNLEPRLGVQYFINEKQSLSLGLGLHSKMLPIGAYFTNPQARYPNLPVGDGANEDLKFMKAAHAVLGYEANTSGGTRFRAEAYYQYLYDVPVDATGTSSWSMINTVVGFPDRWLTNDGTGTNYGLDLSIEKTFDEGRFLLLSGSVFLSEYTDFNDNTHPTVFASGSMASLLAGKEVAIEQRKCFSGKHRLLYNGGQRLTPLASNATCKQVRPRASTRRGKSI